MKVRVFCLGLFLSIAMLAVGDENLGDISWGKMHLEGRLAAGDVIPPGGAVPSESLLLSNPTGQPMTINVFTLDKPPITTACYAICGKIRYENVDGTAYLEMWSIFPSGGRFFSRTLGEQGLMQSLRGTSEWREFSVPFYNQEGAPPPSQLIFNIAFAGRGTVVLGQIHLSQFGQGDNPRESKVGWWSARAGGMFGVLFGTIVGCLGGLIGVLTARGKSRRFVFASLIVLPVMGVVVLVSGIVSLSLSQPYHVWYPLILGGALTAIIFWALNPKVRKRYADLELRKIRAMDDVS